MDAGTSVLCDTVLSAESAWTRGVNKRADDCECCSSPRHKFKLTRRLLVSISRRSLSLSAKDNQQHVDNNNDYEASAPAVAVQNDVSINQQLEEPEPQQSPIDIHEDESEIVPTASCPNAVAIAMGEGHAELAFNDHGFCVQWTQPGDNALIVDGKVFRAVQFHFHTPSEHTMDGVHEELEMHMVHQSEDGALAVLGVLIREGERNEFLSEFWATLADGRHLKGDETKIPLGTIDPRELDVQSRSFFRYRGSLTTPPYTEGVEWVVIHDVMEASREQLDMFHNALPGTNARDLQPLNHRHVWFAC